jgi:hypothetical protein
LIDPSFSAAEQMLARNRSAVAQWDLQIAGHSVDRVRRIARHDLLRGAVRYVGSYRDLPAPFDQVGDAAIDDKTAARPLVMAGHQPELFHPGVWFKNFALADFAGRNRATAVNLVVDNDLSGAAAIRVPHLQQGRLGRVAIPFDGPAAAAVPFEQRWIADPAMFARFADEVSVAVRGIVDNPLIGRLWPHAVSASRRCSNVGCALAQARHALEGELGLDTLELPISVVCRSWGFAAFVLSLITELPRLHTCYNESLVEYRRLHGIRSSAHPVPALTESDGWLEAPLWIYGDDDPRRRAAWVRMTGNTLEITDRGSRFMRIDRPESEGAVDQVIAQTGPQFKLRPRALVTTMFARLILSDLFFHGIGGGKYDQLGDVIIQRYFGVTPPGYSVLSATVLLPRDADERSVPAQQDSLLHIQRRLRDIRFSPETFAATVDLPDALLSRKAQLLREIPARGHRAAWHREITSVNRQLSSHLESTAARLNHQLAGAQRDHREAKIWESREHPFPVFPTDYLVEQYRRMLNR